MNDEVWKPIPGWEGAYEASSEGRIRSLPRLGGGPLGGTYRLRGRVLRNSVNSKGGIVSMYRNGQRQAHATAVLIFAAWSGRFPRPGLCVLHRDGDPRNNRPENLVEGTESDRVRLQQQAGRPAGLVLNRPGRKYERRAA